MESRQIERREMQIISGAAGPTAEPSFPASSSQDTDTDNCVVCMNAPVQAGFLHGSRSAMLSCVCSGSVYVSHVGPEAKLSLKVDVPSPVSAESKLSLRVNVPLAM